MLVFCIEIEITYWGGVRMTKNLIFSLAGLFLITAFTNILSTLKTMFISKKIMNPVYILVFVDAIIFATIVGKVTSGDGIQFTIAYALGRSMGVFIGNKLEDRLALGILEVDIFLNHKDKMIELAENLREEGYTVNNYSVSGNNGNKRYKVEVVINRKEFKILEDIVEECGINTPTLKVKNLSNVDGKITTTSI